MISEKREQKIRDVYSKRQKDLAIVLESVWDPHNVSAVFRSCDAVGVDTVYLVYPDGNFPKIALSSSASAGKWINVKKYKSITSCYKALRKLKFHIHTTFLDDSHDSETKSLYDFDLTKKVALVFGNEKDGLTVKALEEGDYNFYIPMVGMVQSLNISVSVAVSLYEAMRQRLKSGSYKCPQYTEKEIDDTVLSDEWSKIKKRLRRI